MVLIMHCAEAGERHLQSLTPHSWLAKQFDWFRWVAITSLRPFCNLSFSLMGWAGNKSKQLNLDMRNNCDLSSEKLYLQVWKLSLHWNLTWGIPQAKAESHTLGKPEGAAAFKGKGDLVNKVWQVDIKLRIICGTNP
jgi:hypothetical protein